MYIYLGIYTERDRDEYVYIYVYIYLYLCICGTLPIFGIYNDVQHQIVSHKLSRRTGKGTHKLQLVDRNLTSLSQYWD